jgi:predicted phosphodiesterase
MLSMKKISRRDLLAGLAAGTPFRFALIGDRTGRAQSDVYDRVWAEVAASKPAFVVSIGDTIEGLNDATVEAEWDAIEASTLKLYKTFPFYHVAGNHDVWSEKSERVYERRTGRPVRLGMGAHPFVWLMEKHRVDFVFSGHVHQFMSLERAGVRYVMIGSSGGAMDRGVSGGFREGWFYHWLDIEVAGAGGVGTERLRRS